MEEFNSPNSSKKNISEQIQKKELTQQVSDESKRKLLTMIGHDLKNPLSALSGYCYIMIEEFSELDDEDKLEYIKSMKRITTSMGDFLNNLAQWTSIQLGIHTISPERINFKEILKEVLHFQLEYAVRKKIKLINNCVEDYIIFVDPNVVNLIINNLLSNAIKYSHHGSEVEIKTELNKSRLKIIISDTGIGMDFNINSNLLTSGKIKPVQGTAKETGSGLGLILVRSLLGSTGGKLDIESKLNIGTKVSFILPLA